MGTYKTISEISPCSCSNLEEGNCSECPYCEEIDGILNKFIARTTTPNTMCESNDPGTYTVFAGMNRVGQVKVLEP